MNYAEKLKDPRWQKKRLEILNRDNWTCRSCQRKDHTLAVHHLRYEEEPWEVNNEDLVTLCDVCHDAWHKIYGLGIDASLIFLVVKLTQDIEWENIQNYLIKYGQEVH